MSKRPFFTTTALTLLLSTASLTLSACDTNLTIIDDLRDGLADAQIDLAGAIAKAEVEVPDGVIVDAEFEFEHQRLQYGFVIWRGGQEVRLELSAADGRVLKNRAEVVDADDAAELGAQAQIVEAANLSFAEAIVIAQQESGGTAFEIEAEDGVFEVEVLVGDAVWELDIDPATGAVTKSELSDDWADEDDEVEDDD